ncbi:hypothetical protein Trihar35433_7494 [Trichoderma harzianum]|nr:hypothetical protein Trihar35433_7494 [Trichoderma harzianum]
MADPKIYTVGWICALPTEFVAAISLLDEQHDQPTKISHGDCNYYTLGKIASHNVVMTVLPEGEYGTASAAAVAATMLCAFPDIKIGLMVGIGGGAPSWRHDIRLGDVVVSYPFDERSGVLRYDFGKTIQNQPFRITGFLSQPPTMLRTAVNRLRTRYEKEGHQINRTIESIIKQRPRLRRKYQRPPSSSDRLYQSTFTHAIGNETSCADLCGDGPFRIVQRQPREDEEKDNPVIHYGLIASANQVMKNAVFRDKLAVEEDVLCFEMEAAGLMNHFPCLVIRGICDYSDTHKNKEWQGYAAMAAAAYAKDLLLEIPVQPPTPERSTIEVIGSLTESGFGEVSPGALGGIGGPPPNPPTSDLVGYLSRESVDACIARDREQFISKTRELIQKIINANIPGGIWYHHDEVADLSRQWREYFHLHRMIPFEGGLSGSPSPQTARSYLVRMISDTRLGGGGISAQTADLYDVIAVMDYVDGWQKVDIQDEEDYEWI